MHRVSRPAEVRVFSTVLPALVFVAIWGSLLPFQPSDGMSPGVLVWWTALCAVSIFNIWAWRLSGRWVARCKAETDPLAFGFQRWQLFLCAIYVFGCAFRSVLPRGDVQRIGMFDTWMSSVFVGRSVATLVELCFAAQWALWLCQTARHANSPITVAVSWLLVPLIVVAELCSWHAVLTTNYLGNVIEESIWALAGILVVIGCAALWYPCARAARIRLALVMLCGLAFVTYMCTVDVPMYAGRWIGDEAGGKTYLSLTQGLWDAGSRWTVTHSWDQWRPEVLWMTLYFSVGVWTSLALVHASRFASSRRGVTSLAQT